MIGGGVVVVVVVRTLYTPTFVTPIAAILWYTHNFTPF